MHLTHFTTKVLPATLMQDSGLPGHQWGGPHTVESAFEGATHLLTMLFIHMAQRHINIKGTLILVQTLRLFLVRCTLNVCAV